MKNRTLTTPAQPHALLQPHAAPSAQRRALLELSLGLGTAALLQACGGGGGGDAPAPAPAPAPPPAPKFWSGAVPINGPTDRGGQNPQTTMDANGNAFVVWRQQDGVNDFNNSVWVNYYNASAGTWDTPAPLDTQANDVDPTTSIAMDAKGNAMVVWSQRGGSNGVQSYAKRYVAGSGWGGDVPLGGSVDMAASQPQVAMDTAGNAFAVWTQVDSSAADSPLRIWARRFDAVSGVWGSAAPIEASTKFSLRPILSVDASGAVTVVWTQSTLIGAGGEYSIWSNRFNGTAWGTAVPLLAQAGDAGDTSIATDGKGNALTTWTQVDGTQSTIWTRRYNNTSHTWGQALPVSKPGRVNSSRVVFDPAGNAMVVWAQQSGAIYEVSARLLDASTGVWGEVVTLGQTSRPVMGLQIAIDANGNAMAAWIYWDGKTQSVFYNRYSAGRWGSATPLEQDDTVISDTLGVRIAMNANGAAMAVWSQFTSPGGVGVSRIFANVYR
jgi:hypothetical protein